MPEAHRIGFARLPRVARASTNSRAHTCTHVHTQLARAYENAVSNGLYPTARRACTSCTLPASVLLSVCAYICLRVCVCVCTYLPPSPPPSSPWLSTSCNDPPPARCTSADIAIRTRITKTASPGIPRWWNLGRRSVRPSSFPPLSRSSSFVSFWSLLFVTGRYRGDDWTRCNEQGATNSSREGTHLDANSISVAREHLSQI